MGIRNKVIRPVQLVKAKRLYKQNPEARAELTRLGDAAEADPSMTRETYLTVEADIIGRHFG